MLPEIWVLFIPLEAIWQDVMNILLMLWFKFFCRLSNLWCDKHWFAKHELTLQSIEITHIREVIPHRSHNWLSGCSGMVEGSIEIMNHVIALVDGVANDRLHSLRLIPRLSVSGFDRAVSSEEWIVHSKLIESNPDLFRRLADKAWNIGTTEDIPA